MVNLILNLRFFDPIPSVIIYDFACKAEGYIRRMDHEKLFENSKFYIDAFHAKGHTCSSKYHIDKARDGRLTQIRSELAEMNNAYLSFLKRSLRYAGQHTAYYTIREFLEIKNDLIIHKRRTETF